MGKPVAQATFPEQAFVPSEDTNERGRRQMNYEAAKLFHGRQRCHLIVRFFAKSVLATAVFKLRERVSPPL